jgi:hypothetical protein
LQATNSKFEAKVNEGKTELEALRDRFEILSTGANYLLLGHSVGLIGCLSVFKEHTDLAPPFDQLDLLILLFGNGLLLGALFWAAAVTVKISVTQTIISQSPPKTRVGWLLGKTIEWLAFFGLWASLIAFVAAVLLITYPFYGIFRSLKQLT